MYVLLSRLSEGKLDPNQIGLHESGAESSSDEFEVRRGGGRGQGGRGMRGHLPGFTLLTLPLATPDFQPTPTPPIIPPPIGAHTIGD